jgi:hypothetical protein
VLLVPHFVIEESSIGELVLQQTLQQQRHVPPLQKKSTAAIAATYIDFKLPYVTTTTTTVTTFATQNHLCICCFCRILRIFGTLLPQIRHQNHFCDVQVVQFPHIAPKESYG